MEDNIVDTKFSNEKEVTTSKVTFACTSSRIYYLNIRTSVTLYYGEAFQLRVFTKFPCSRVFSSTVIQLYYYIFFLLQYLLHLAVLQIQLQLLVLLQQWLHAVLQFTHFSLQHKLILLSHWQIFSHHFQLSLDILDRKIRESIWYKKAVQKIQN